MNQIKTQAPAGATPQAFRQVMGSFATGVAVTTTAVDGELHGMTVNSLASVSLDPLIVLVCLVKGSRTGAAIRERGRFAINLLSAEQEDISRRFVSKNMQRFEDGDSAANEWEVPLLEGRLGHIVCDVHLVQEMGDHDVVYGRVLHCAAGEGKPLLFWRGAYSMLASPAASGC
jgi:3-hydroxy-9,10-secoandrosta-1,3,5(10)-triene-9,17-dione monooxygenase reductase component